MKRNVEVLEIPEGVNSLWWKADNPQSFNLLDYDSVGKLILPSTLRIENVPQESYVDLLNKSFEVCHSRMWFSACEGREFMTMFPLSCKAIRIGEIENHSTDLCVKDGVIYSSDMSRLIFCHELKSSFNVPDSVRIIESQAFCGQSGLQSIILPPLLEEIHSQAFAGCTSLESIDIPNGVETICWGAFCGCTSLKEVKLPNLVRKLGNDAFWHCDSLAHIELPDSIEEMNSFACCISLEKVRIPKCVTCVRGFEMCSELREVELQSGVTSIDSYAFRGCESLSRINFPEGMEKIGARAFYPSSLGKVILPSTLQEIGCEAFYRNERLRYIEFNSCPEIEQAAFACIPTARVIRKPTGFKIGRKVFEQDTTLDKYGFWD